MDTKLLQQINQYHVTGVIGDSLEGYIDNRYISVIERPIEVDINEIGNAGNQAEERIGDGELYFENTFILARPLSIDPAPQERQEEQTLEITPPQITIKNWLKRIANNGKFLPVILEEPKNGGSNDEIQIHWMDNLGSLAQFFKKLYLATPIIIKRKVLRDETKMLRLKQLN